MLLHHRSGVRHFRRTGDLLSDLVRLPDPARERRQRLTGIALMAGACACFACLDASAKYLTGHMDTLEVVWARYTSAFLLALILSNPVIRPGVMTTRRPLLQIGRSALMLLSTVLNLFALRYLQLDEALSILFSTPFLIAVLSGPMLGEWIGWRRWTAIGIRFVGVLVVVRPGLGGIQWSRASSCGIHQQGRQDRLARDHSGQQAARHARAGRRQGFPWRWLWQP